MQKIPLSAIDASKRLRPVDPDHVALIAASIEEKGLLQPVVVRPRGDAFALTAGAHRLRALADLGWKELVVGQHVLVQERDDLDAQIDEIDENLARRELNALDRALFMAARKRLYDERNRTRGKGGDRKSEIFNSATCGIDYSPRFTLEVAGRVGLSEDSVARALKIATLAPQAIAALRGTRIERNQRELLALAEMAVSEQVAVSGLIGKGEAKSVSEGRVSLGLDKPVSTDEQTRVWARLLECWDRANKRTRADFLETIGAEIVKRERA